MAMGMYARLEHKHILKLHFLRNECQVNVLSVLGHLALQEPAEKVPGAHHINVATENSRFALARTPSS